MQTGGHRPGIQSWVRSLSLRDLFLTIAGGSQAQPDAESRIRENLCMCQAFLSGYLWITSPKIWPSDLLLIMKAWPSSKAYPQLALIAQINLFLLIYILPHVLCPSHSVCPLAPCFSVVSTSFPRIHCLSGSPTYSLLPNYWPSSSSLNHSEGTLANTHFHSVKRISHDILPFLSK